MKKPTTFERKEKKRKEKKRKEKKREEKRREEKRREEKRREEKKRKEKKKPIRIMSGAKVLNHYVLKEKLGEGGFGTAFRAEHDQTGAVVAIKFVTCKDGEEELDVFAEVCVSMRK